MKKNKFRWLISCFGLLVPALASSAVVLVSCSKASNPYENLINNASYLVNDSKQANQLFEVAKTHLPVVANFEVSIDEINHAINQNQDFIYWDLTASIMQFLVNDFHNVSLTTYEVDSNQTNGYLSLTKLSIIIQEQLSIDNIACRIDYYANASQIYLQIKDPNDQQLYSILSYQYKDAILKA